MATKKAAPKATPAVTPARDPRIPTTFEPGAHFALPLWPKWGEPLLRREERKGKWSFDRGFRQRARRDEDRRFGDLTKFLRADTKVADLVRPDFPRFGGFDPAGDKRIGNALVVAAVNPETGLRTIVEIDIWRGSFGETFNHIIMADHRNHFAMLVVENNGVQSQVAGAITHHPLGAGLPVLPWNTGMNKAHPEYGLPGLDAQFREGHWALCMGDDYGTGSPLQSHDADCECAAHMLLGDLENWPAPTKTGIAEMNAERTYDLLMALWFCSEGIRGAVTEPEDNIPEGELALVPDGEYGGNFIGGSLGRGMVP